MKIGLTGGIGCGKSAVGRILRELGLHHLDTDQVARQVVEPGTEGLKSIEQTFGPHILQSDGRLDRAKLGEVVFNSNDRRKQLETILHPLIWGEVEHFLEQAEGAHCSSVVEVPLLFENSREDIFDKIWVVATTPSLQLERLMARNGWSREQVDARLSSQMPLEDKVARADRVFWNNGELAELRDAVTKAWQELEFRTPN